MLISRQRPLETGRPVAATDERLTRTQDSDDTEMGVSNYLSRLDRRQSLRLCQALLHALAVAALVQSLL